MTTTVGCVLVNHQLSRQLNLIKRTREANLIKTLFYIEFFMIILNCCRKQKKSD